ncbi:MAG: hypothetical protein MRZ79_17260 [Bacteroidia bacterium]|nr:hypothetical protein [Bacteroidia bacterium]
MNKTVFFIIGFVFIMICACNPDRIRPNGRLTIPDFNFPETIVFEQNLSAYNIFEGNAADLIPASDFHLVELSSILFTDYSHKQRLIKVPAGTKMTKQNDGTIDYPDGTIMTKTFFYQNDERDSSLGKRIIETRLEIKENGIWNIATYLWNQSQTEATLSLDGLDTQVNWVNAAGIPRSTLYHVPSQNECMTCHQSDSEISPIGPSLRNLNRLVERNGTNLNQLTHLQSIGILDDFDITQASRIVNYNDPTASLSDRGRAYMDMNCAHCHNPDGWDYATERQFDFRYETSLAQSGILFEEDKISNALLDGEMPFIGTTLLDEEGVSLVIEYLDSL